MEPPVTSVSLLSRLRDLTDHASWREFDRRYRELLLRFCRRQGLSAVDAEDVVQKVLVSMTRTLPQFTYDSKRGRFRDYLYRCVRNGISEWTRRPNPACPSLLPCGDACADAADRASDQRDPLEEAWESEWVAHHYRLAMTSVRQTFDARSVEVFDRSVAGAKVAELARVFEMSEQAVYKVRQRIRARMEELIAQQVRDEDAIDA